MLFQAGISSKGYLPRRRIVDYKVDGMILKVKGRNINLPVK